MNCRLRPLRMDRKCTERQDLAGFPRGQRTAERIRRVTQNRRESKRKLANSETFWRRAVQLSQLCESELTDSRTVIARYGGAPLYCATLRTSSFRSQPVGVSNTLAVLCWGPAVHQAKLTEKNSLQFVTCTTVYRVWLKFHLARLDSTRLDTFDFVEAVEQVETSVSSETSRALSTWRTTNDLVQV